MSNLTEKELLYATTNNAKVISLQRFFKNHKIKITQLPLKLPEPRSNQVKHIAIKKVKYAFNATNKPVLVSDVAFYISVLHGFPGTFINFVLETIGVEGILKLVNNDRTCKFVECLAYFDSTLHAPKCFVGIINGTLSKSIHEVRNHYLWSELGRVFIPEGTIKTLAAMSDDEYLKWNKDFRENKSVYANFAQWYYSHIK